MELVTNSHDQNSGWRQRLRADLDSPSTLVIAFGATELVDRPAALDELRAAYPRSLLVGCSTAGEIHGAQVCDGTVSVAVARFERTELAYAQARVDDAAGSRGAGEAIARALLRPDLRAVLVLSDGLHVNGTALVEGLNAVLPSRASW